VVPADLDGINGQLRVALLDPENDDIAIPGYSLNDSVPLSVNSVDACISWQSVPTDDAASSSTVNNKPVGAGSRVRVEFHLLEAKLYSFQFRDDD
jgi:hypothetical protein